MKTYVIIGNEFEGIYTDSWNNIQKLIQTKPSPIYKGFNTKLEAELWFDDKINNPLKKYSIYYNGDFKIDNSAFYFFMDGGNRNSGNTLGSHVNDNDKSAWAIAIYQGNNLNTPLYYKSKAYYGATNNRMEISALLEAITYSINNNINNVHFITDSKYVLDSVTNWIYSWQQNNWTKKNGQIINVDLWKKIFTLINSTNLSFYFIWVKGHLNTNGNLFVDNLLNIEMNNL